MSKVLLSTLRQHKYSFAINRAVSEDSARLRLLIDQQQYARERPSLPDHIHQTCSRSVLQILGFYCDTCYRTATHRWSFKQHLFPRKPSYHRKFCLTTSSGIQTTIGAIRVSIPGELDLHLLIPRDPAKPYYSFSNSPPRAELIEEQKQISR